LQKGATEGRIGGPITFIVRKSKNTGVHRKVPRLERGGKERNTAFRRRNGSYHESLAKKVLKGYEQGGGKMRRTIKKKRGTSQKMFETKSHPVTRAA